jgi:hypothetical protein
MQMMRTSYLCHKNSYANYAHKERFVINGNITIYSGGQWNKAETGRWLTC